MPRQVSVYDHYHNAALTRKIWEKTRDDFFNGFKVQNPNAGRDRYLKYIEETLFAFDGVFYMDCGESYDPLAESVSGKTLENFICKPEHVEPVKAPQNKTLRLLHAYLLVKYPQITHSLRVNDYAIQYAQMLEAKFLSWARSDQKTLSKMKRLAQSISGIFVNELLEDWPKNQRSRNADEYKAAQRHFGGPYRLLIISSMDTDPIMLVHYLSFTEKDIPKLAKGQIDHLKLGRASGAMVPVIVKPEDKTYLIRFDLFMSNRMENDLPFHFPILVENGDYTKIAKMVKINSFTANRFDYAPQCRFVRTESFEVAGKKLLDLYGVDI